MKSSLALAAIASLAAASSAFAQAPATPAAAPVGGPPIAGVCTFYRDAAVNVSAVGKAMNERLKQLSAAVQAELTPEAQYLGGEQRALEALPRDQVQANGQRIGAFQERAAAFEKKRQLRLQELQATKQKQENFILTQADPIIGQVYQERNCGLLIERGALYGANPAMDVTDTVIQRLNAKISTVNFDREHLDQPQSAAATPAPDSTPKPAATTTKKKK